MKIDVVLKMLLTREMLGCYRVVTVVAFLVTEWRRSTLLMIQMSKLILFKIILLWVNPNPELQRWFFEGLGDFIPANWTSSSTAQMHVLPWQLSEGKRDSSFSVSKLMAGGGAKFCFFIEYLLGVKIASVFLFLQYPAPLASFLTWAAWLFGCFWKDKERGENIYHLQKCKWTLSQPLKGDSANFHSYPK